DTVISNCTRSNFNEFVLFFFSSRSRHTIFSRDWSSDVCSSDLGTKNPGPEQGPGNHQQADRHQSQPAGDPAAQERLAERPADPAVTPGNAEQEKPGYPHPDETRLGGFPESL